MMCSVLAPNWNSNVTMPRNTETTSYRVPVEDAQKIIQDAGGYKDKTIASVMGEVCRQFVLCWSLIRWPATLLLDGFISRRWRRSWQHARKIIIDPNADGKAGVVPYLPLPGLK